MSKGNKKLKKCDTCGKLFPAGKLTSYGLCPDCDEEWVDDYYRTEDPNPFWKMVMGIGTNNLKPC